MTGAPELAHPATNKVAPHCQARDITRSMRGLLLCGFLTGLTSHLLAQDWNSADALALVQRAVVRRTTAGADPALQHVHSRARGTILLLTRLGRDPSVAPRLFKTDQLDVEVYWRAPNQSKQIIRAWRERTDFPTDIRYHRDHLGIIPDDFGPLIRLGDGQEIRDLVHPLSPAGGTVYEYAAGDSLVMDGAGARLSVRVVQVRPRDPSSAAVVGTLYLDMATGALVRFRFTFTATAYRQPGLETIMVDLESALFDQRHWLPYRQRLEITRGSSWLDLAAASVIRTDWEIGEYEFGVPAPDAIFGGGPYGGLRVADPGGRWDEPLDSVIGRAQVTMRGTDLGEIRREVEQALGPAALRPRPPVRPAFGSLSDLVVVNRVQGLAIGAGLVIRPSAAVGLRPWIQVATVDGSIQGGMVVQIGDEDARLEIEGSRAVRDFSDVPVVSRAVNSITAQEGGQDHGDFVQLDRVEARWRSVGLSSQWFVGLGLESSGSMEARATPSSGSYRPNPALGAGGIVALRGGWSSRHGSPGRGLRFEIGGEGGLGDRDYAQARGTFEGWIPAPAGQWRLRGSAAGTVGVPPAHRLLAIGGRGTLPGEPYRAWGGTTLLFARADWILGGRIPMPRVGGYPPLRDPVTVGPFLAVGVAGGESTVEAWQSGGGLRPVMGIAAEFLFGLLRVEAGWAPRSGRFGVLLDAAPAWWPIL